MIREKAKTLMANSSPLSNFKASKGWLQLFLKRKSLNLRRKTSVSPSNSLLDGQDMPSDTTINVREAKSVSLRTTGHDHDYPIGSCRWKEIEAFCNFQREGNPLKVNQGIVVLSSKCLQLSEMTFSPTL